MDLIVLGESRLVDHDAAELMLILALQRLDDFAGLIWLEVHFRLIDNVGVWRCRKTEVDFGVVVE